MLDKRELIKTLYWLIGAPAKVVKMLLHLQPLLPAEVCYYWSGVPGPYPFGYQRLEILRVLAPYFEAVKFSDSSYYGKINPYW